MIWRRTGPDPENPERDAAEPKDGVISLSVPVGVGAALSISETATPRFVKAWGEDADRGFPNDPRMPRKTGSRIATESRTARSASSPMSDTPKS